MTIITLKDINTGEKFRVKSIIDPVVNAFENGPTEILQRIRWLYEETGEDVHPEFHDVLNLLQLKRFIGRHHIIDNIE